MTDAQIQLSGVSSARVTGAALTNCGRAPTMDAIVDSLLAGKAVPTSAAIYSRALVSELRWDEELRKLDDWDWFIRAALRARKIVRAPMIAYSWRILGLSIVISLLTAATIVERMLNRNR